MHLKNIRKLGNS